jgi:beta-lactamase class C
MKKIFLTLFIFIVASANAAESLIDPALKSLLDQTIQRFMQRLDAPGVAVALYHDGKAYLINYGMADRETNIPVTSDTIFEIASITKVFTSTALAYEVVQGNMHLNDSVILYFPALSNTTGPIGQITLLHLATHRSSLPRMPPPLRGGRQYDPNGLVAFLKTWKPDYPIATRYVYSNLGFAILGQAIANVLQTNYEGVIKQVITGPLEMHSTMVNVPAELQNNYAQGYNKQGKRAKRYGFNPWPGGGALRSTGRDMLKFLLANLGIEGPSDLVKAMEFAQKGQVKISERLTMGLGWQVFKSDEGAILIDKNGGVVGFSSYIGMIPATKSGIVLLCNKGKTQITQLGREILLRLNAK